MKNIIFTLLIFISLHPYSFSQNIIKGKVVDAVSRQPLELVTVSTSAGNKTATDVNGNFYLRTEKAVTGLSVSYIGYKTSAVTINDTKELLITLQPASYNLSEVTLQSGIKSKFTNVAKIDLDLKPVRNTQELLRLVPGLFIAQHAGGGKAEQIFLRGFDCDHGTDVQVSVDGMPVNMVSHAHGQGYADSHFIIPETINKIDYGVGPYYTEHGNLNTAGYVAFSTYKNIPMSRVQVEAGRFNTFRELILLDLLKKNKDKQSAYIAAEYNYTNGPTINKQHFNRFNIFGKYNVSLSRSTRLTAAASAFKSNWDASGQEPTRAVEEHIISRFGSIDPSEGGNTERYNVNLVLSTQFRNGAALENRAFYSRYIFNLYSDFTFYLDDPINGDEINQAEKRNVYGYNSTFTKKYFIGHNNTLTSTYGAGLRYDATTGTKLAHVVKREFLDYIKYGDINEANASAYTDQQIVAGKFLIDAGARLDYFTFKYFDRLNTVQLPSQQKAIVSPKLNIQYTVDPKMQVYVKAGKGFHSNDTRVVIANAGHQILPAAYGTDLGVILKPVKNFYLNVALWTLYLQQEFVYAGDDGNIEPSGKTRRQGIDVIARYQLSKNFFANTNINFTKPRALGEPKGENYIPLAPLATSTGGIFYKPKLGFNGGITYRYIKSRPASEDNSIVAKGYFLTDASFNYTKKKYEIGVALENIFNVKWNEAQFATESRLQNEPASVTELNFTPGTPVFARVKFAVFF